MLVQNLITALEMVEKAAITHKKARFEVEKAY